MNLAGLQVDHEQQRAAWSVSRNDPAAALGDPSFKQKRKQLINNFQDYLNISKSEIISFFINNQISLNIRAEEINVEDLQKIAKL
ncbi:MAG: hypothetical protein Q8869_03345, partial [Candidatus Phytoplasma australasiaticum]|nr:hypothetical protein [Candidatus Phytoplasma australasiaticum]